MNPVTIKVAIVGLCTLMNVRNKDTFLPPPPALIIPRVDLRHGGIAETHVPFIGWNRREVTPSGTTPLPVFNADGSPTDYEYTPLDGDLIEIANLPNDGNKQLTLDQFLNVATHSEYWDNVPPPQAYDSHFVPEGLNRMGTPDDKYVAGYFRFGTEGSLVSSHPTTQAWVFRNAQTSHKLKRTFMQEVDYTYEGKADGGFAVVEITLKDLAGTSPDRNIKLMATNANTPLTFFLGNATKGGMHYLMSSSDPGPDDQCRAVHFRAIHMIANTGNDKEMPIPEPEQIGKNCTTDERQMHEKHIVRPSKALAHSVTTPGGGAAGDSTGYCGPDSKP